MVSACQTVTPGMSARTRLPTSIFYFLDNSARALLRAALTANQHFSSEAVTKAQHAQTSQKGLVSPGANEEIPGRASVKTFLRTEAVGSGTICLQYYTYLWYNYTTFNYSSHWTNKSLWTKSLWKASIFPYVILIYFTCKTNLAKHANWKSYFSGIPWKIK